MSNRNNRHAARSVSTVACAYVLVIAFFNIILSQKSLKRFHGQMNIGYDDTQLVLKEQDSRSSMYNLIDRSKRVEIPDKNRTLAFVHVGKSGGSTISMLLRNGCIQAVEGGECEAERWKKFPGEVGKIETVASQRIQFYLHLSHVDSGKMSEYYDRISSIVVVARDPLDRWVSAFLSMHPKIIAGMRRRNIAARFEAERDGVNPPVWAYKQFFPADGLRNATIYMEAYNGCYPNVEEFVKCAFNNDLPSERDLFIKEIKWETTKAVHRENILFNCRDICSEIAAATSRYIPHVRVNYEAYLKELPPSKEVFVIRTKKLWEDWVNVNNLLGSPNDVPVPNSEDEGQSVNSQGDLPLKSNLSDKGRKLLCKLLQNEYALYIDLLNRAVNLSDDDVKHALNNAYKNCPDILEAYN